MSKIASTSLTTVERLKAEANALHQEGSYQAAYQKYSEAIRETPSDPILAILYANRAASCLSMKEYMDGLHDGQKAANLDPTYAKAYARMGTAAQALEMWDVCREAWKSALTCLPAKDLTPTQLVLKAQFEAGLNATDSGMAKSQAKADRSVIQLAMGPKVLGNMPWDRALALAEKNQLARGPVPSSGFVILNAYRDFIRGVKTMQQIMIKDKGDRLGIKAVPDALVDITNGILRDTRVFHADHRFFEQLESQVRFEVEMAGAWTSGGPKKVQSEVLVRQRKEGWLSVRRALSVTVRVWMMRAFLDDQMGARTRGVEFYQRILDLLEWGRRTWPNVPSEDRGIIFEASFVRGIRRLHLSAVWGLYSNGGAESGYTLENIAQMARDLIAETQASTLPPDWLNDPGFYASFWIYPIAQGLSILGWYHMQLGLKRIDSGEDLDTETAVNFKQSSQYYIQAAEKYPEDDEQRPRMLAVALEALWWGGAPLRVTLPLCRKIRAAMPTPTQIWESLMTIRKRNPNCEGAVVFLDDCERKLADGIVTLDSILMPSDLVERRAGKVADLRND